LFVKIHLSMGTKAAPPLCGLCPVTGYAADLVPVPGLFFPGKAGFSLTPGTIFRMIKGTAWAYFMLREEGFRDGRKPALRSEQSHCPAPLHRLFGALPGVRAFV